MLGRFRTSGTIEHDKHKAEHVEGGQSGDEDSYYEQPPVARCCGGNQNGVFAEKPTKWPHAREGEGADEKGPEGHGHFPAKSAHFPNVLFMMQCDNNRACAEKE